MRENPPSHAFLTREEQHGHGHNGELLADVEEVVHLPDERVQGCLGDREGDDDPRQDV